MSAVVWAAAGWLCTGASLAVLLLWRARLESRLALVAEATHELRGPLTAVQLGIAGLARDPLPAATRRRAGAIELELRRAGRALEDLAAAPEGRRAPDARGPVDVADLLEELGHAWAGTAAAFGTRVLAERPAEWWVVRADRVRLAQALGNLVANAVEHGGGPVRLRARRSEEGLRLEVVDAGRGLPLGIPVVGPHAGPRGHGLAVARRVAEMSGGRLLSERTGGGGHVMALELPVAPIATPEVLDSLPGRRSPGVAAFRARHQLSDRIGTRS